MKKVLIVFSFFFFGFLCTHAVFAEKAVLGLATQTISMQPTYEGPGLLLPDNPLYFLDYFKQDIRLFFAFTPLQKAQIYSDVAGERLAELRFMILRKNDTGALIAMNGIVANTKNEAEELSLAGESVDTVSVAQVLSLRLSERLALLDSVYLESHGMLQQEIGKVTIEMTRAKEVVENYLPEDVATQAVMDDVDRQIRLESPSKNSSQLIEEAVMLLQQQANDSATKNLSLRNMAVQEDLQNEKLTYTKSLPKAAALH